MTDEMKRRHWMGDLGVGIWALASCEEALDLVLGREAERRWAGLGCVAWRL
jgi:hypothetical protein